MIHGELLAALDVSCPLKEVCIVFLPCLSEYTEFFHWRIWILPSLWSASRPGFRFSSLNDAGVFSPSGSIFGISLCFALFVLSCGLFETLLCDGGLFRRSGIVATSKEHVAWGEFLCWMWCRAIVDQQVIHCFLQRFLSIKGKFCCLPRGFWIIKPHFPGEDMGEKVLQVFLLQ